MAAGVLHFPGYLGQRGSRCARLAGWDRVVDKSRTTAAMAAGASYLSGIDLEMSNSGLNSLKSRTPAVAAAGGSYLAAGRLSLTVLPVLISNFLRVLNL